MGIKSLILLALLIGVLYCIHILVKDYQALSAAKVLRLLFKRDLTSHTDNRVNVRWKKILQYDKIQCTQMLYCDLGQRPADTHLRKDFIQMLSLEPKEEDSSALNIFKLAYNNGKISNKDCRKIYLICPFEISFLYNVINFLLKT